MSVSACLNCQTALPPDARFCPTCGTSVLPSPPDIFAPPPTEDMEQELADCFMRELERAILDQQDPRMVDQYFQRFHESGFPTDLEHRLRQLLEPLARAGINTVTQEVLYEIYSLVDFFLIRFCSDLNQIYLPQAILKYHGIDGNQVDLYRMSMDFMAFDHEDVRIYTDFLSMPEKTLKKVSKSFLFADRTERLWFICDQTLRGTGKAGFAMTNQSIYWKAPMQPAHVFRYGHPLTIQFESDWMTLNGAFFDAGKALNVRLSKLLQRLQMVF
ncbi:MAG: zinc ribbon domain-containing protein [Saprospiraceae bacterium]|nr:zinc ribbon domain-containing protein [Saprospiraceae bacterium]